MFCFVTMLATTELQARCSNVGHCRFLIKCLDKGSTGQQLGRGAAGIGSSESHSLTPNLYSPLFSPREAKAPNLSAEVRNLAFFKKNNNNNFCGKNISHEIYPSKSLSVIYNTYVFQTR